MRREVVQDFLNLPGITGVALMDGRSRPYFYGAAQTLNYQQREALTQGIQQVVATTPPGFDTFEFQFTRHHAYIHKLDHGITLLVLTAEGLALSNYHQAIAQLQQEVQHEATNAIATFRLIASNIPLPPALTTPLSPEAEVSLQYPETTDLIAPSASRCLLQEMLEAINQVSHFTTQYLGNTVVGNYWKATRPEADWLKQFQIERTAQIRYQGHVAPTQHRLSVEEQQYLRDWTNAFVDRCAKVIRDFPTLLTQSALTEQQCVLLFPHLTH